MLDTTNSSFWFHIEWPWYSLRTTGLWKSKDWYSHSVVKLREAAQMFVMVDCIREMTVKKSCKYGECGLSEHLLFLFTTFRDRDVGWGWQDQHKVKPVGFILFHTFSSSQLNLIWCWVSSSWISLHYSWARVIESRETTAVLLTASKTLILACFHMDTYKLICFKLCRMPDITKLYSIFQFNMTLTFIQSRRIMGELELVQSFCCREL